MLSGNLMDYVGKNVKCDGKNGTITGLMNAAYTDADVYGKKDDDDQVFEVTWSDGQIDNIAARNSVLEELGYEVEQPTE